MTFVNRLWFDRILVTGGSPREGPQLITDPLCDFMKRRILTCLSAASLLSCFALLGNWPMSYRYHDTVSFHVWDNLVGIGSLRGKVRISVITNFAGQAGTGIRRLPAGDLANTFDHAFIGFGYASGRIAYGLPRKWASNYTIAFPYWSLVLLTMLLPIYWIWHHIHGIRNGHLCPACGYDLRASKDSCPECGAAIVERHISRQSSRRSGGA